MTRPFPLKIFLCRLFVALVCPFLLSACSGGVHAPQAANIMGPGFAHKGITANCASCHDTGKPFGCFPASGHQDTKGADCSACHTVATWKSTASPHVAGAAIPTQCISCHASSLPKGPQGAASLSNNLTPAGGIFDHSANGGNADCVTCHTAVPANVGVTWSGGVFPHPATLTSCAGCHTSTQQPVGLVGSPPFDHATVAAGTDCASCHAGNPANIGKVWSQAAFPHSPAPAACASCHAADPVYTSIQNTVKNQMNHVLAGLPDCAKCHSSAAAGTNWSSWKVENVAAGTSTARPSLGVFHSAMSVSPNSCQTCHTSERPSGLVGTASLTGNLTPTGGLFDHAANGGTGDCVSCHTSAPANIGLSWTGGIYNHNPMPTTCSGCHTAAQRPTGSVGNPSFDHAANGGTGDCVSCHAANPANVGKTWSLGQFAHNPQPASCATCHTADVVYTAIQNKITSQMDHAVTGLPDCATCHASAASASTWTSWKAETVANGTSTARATLGVFHAGLGSAPSTCQACHSNERPATPVGSPPFDHMTGGGTGDCVSCHSASVGLSWAGGQFTHSPVPAACASCHSTDSIYTSIQGTIKNQMNHAFSGLPDCATCHASTAASKNFSASGGTANGWYLESLTAAANPTIASKGPFHAGVSTTPSSCNACHSADLPTGAVGSPTTFDHAGLNLSTTDCVACHSAGAGLTWTGATGHSSSLTSCYSCHGPSNATTAALMNASSGYQMYHSYSSILTTGTPDCYACHGHASNFTSWALTDRVAANTTPPTLSARREFHAGIGTQPSTCASCHTAEVPTTTVPDTVDGFDHAAKYGTECATCHTNIASNTGTTWTSPFFNHMGNNPAALGTCSPCHDTRFHNAGQLCTGCHTNVTWPIPASSPPGWSNGSFGNGGN